MKSPLDFAARLWSGMLFLNAMVIGLAAFTIHADRKGHDQRARVTAENISLLLERDASTTFDRIGQSLKSVTNAIELRQAEGAFHPNWINLLLKNQRSFLPEVVSFGITDAQGIVRHGDDAPGDTSGDVSDREFFVRHRDTANAGLVIAKPVKTYRNWVIPVSRRLNQPNGEFAGVVFVGIPVDHFVRQYAALSLGDHGVVLLRTADHVSMARYPAQQGIGLGEFAVSDTLRTLLQDDPGRVTYVAPSPADGLERTISYVKLASYPLYIVVGVATQDYLEEWKWDAARTLGVAFLFFLVTLLFSWWMQHAWRRQLRSEEALSVSEERFRLIFQHSPLGFAIIDGNRQFVDANDAFCHMVGYTFGELQGKSFLDITHPDDRTADETGIRDLFAGQRPLYAVEKRYRHKNGHEVWAHLTAVAIRGQRDAGLYGLAIVEDITEKREAERMRIEHLERQRDVLVREVHHRIKNNLQGVVSLIDQLKLKQPASAEVLEEAASQIGAIAVVHGLQSQTIAPEVQPRQLVQAIVDSVARFSEIPVTCTTVDDLSGWNWQLLGRDSVSVALIVNELIYNAIKHTKPGPEAKIEVEFGNRPAAFGILVRNRPATLPADFDWANRAGLGTGLTLIAALLPQHGAALQILQRGDAVEASLQLTHPCAKVPSMPSD